MPNNISTPSTTTTERPTVEEILKQIEHLIKSLTVDISSTSAHKRKFISVEDPRPSSRAIGCSGALMLAAPIVMLALIDGPGIVLACKAVLMAIYLHMVSLRKPVLPNTGV
jgi:hypothetical protein